MAAARSAGRRQPILPIEVSSLLKSYRGQKPKVLKNRTSRVPSRLTLSALTGFYEPLTPLDPPSPLGLVARGDALKIVKEAMGKRCRRGAKK